MKIKTTLFLAAFICCVQLSAQINGLSSFQLQHVSEPYSSLSKSYPNRIEIDDLSNLFAIPMHLPFSYQIAGQMIDSIVIIPDGEINLYSRNGDPNELISLSAFATDLTEKALDSSGINSTISFVVDGMLGSRILKIEYARMGLSKGAVSDEISFQIWLYEHQPMIEYRYGPMSFADTAAVFDWLQGGWPPVVGLAKINWSDETATGVFLTGAGTAPQLVAQSGELSYETLSSPPASDSVYRFCPNGLCQLNTSIGAQDIMAHRLKIFPNPSNGRFTLSLTKESHGEIEFTVYDLQGKLISSLPLIRYEGGKQEIKLDLSHLRAGIYLLQGNTEDSKWYQKLQIVH